MPTTQPQCSISTNLYPGSSCSEDLPANPSTTPNIGSDSADTSIINVGYPSIFWFVIFTLIYCIILYHKESGGGPGTYSIIYLASYLLLVAISQYIFNLGYTASVCNNTPQYFIAFYATFIPWGLIFGIMIVILLINPGWLSPFSNSFGYGLALMGGLDSTINKIFTPEKELDNITDTNIKNALVEIYSNKSLLVNQITMLNFDIFWNNMSNLFKENVKDNLTLKQELRGYICLKEVVSKFIWYICTGILTIYISANYIISSTCKTVSPDSSTTNPTMANATSGAY